MSPRSRRGRGGAFLGACFGLLLVMFTPARPRIFYPSDFDVLMDILWIIGSVSMGGMTGALIARIADRTD